MNGDEAEQAVKQLELELRRDPRNVGIRLRLAAALREAGRDSDAVVHYHALARSYRSAGDLRQAMAACHSALSIDPKHSEIRILLAQLQAEDSKQTLQADTRPPGVPINRRELSNRIRQSPLATQTARRTPPPMATTERATARMTAQASPRKDQPVPVEVSFEAEPGTLTRGVADDAPPGPDFDQFLSADEQDAIDLAAAAAVDPNDEEMARATTEMAVPDTVQAKAPWEDDEPDIDSDWHIEVTEPSASLPLARALAEEMAAEEDDDEELDLTAPGDSHPVIELEAEPAEAYAEDDGEVDRDDDEPLELRNASTHGSGSKAVTKVRGSPSRPDSDRATSDVGLEIARAFDRTFAEALHGARHADGLPGGRAPFPGLSDEALAELSRGIERREAGRGEIILREGEPGDACFVIVRGEVRILKRDPIKPRGDLIEVARLRDGDLFGEFALLADRRRHATVQAVQACQLYVISRRLLRMVSDRHPEVGPQLERFYRERLLQTLLLTAPFFKPLRPERRERLLSRFSPAKIESGDAIIREGEPAGGFYLIVLGSVEITKRVSKHQNVLLATLGEGAYFGELSLLRGDIARATVTATGPVELAMLPPKDFYDVVADNPVLWDQVREVAQQRELETYQIVAGVTSSV